MQTYLMQILHEDSEEDNHVFLPALGCRHSSSPHFIVWVEDTQAQGPGSQVRLSTRDPDMEPLGHVGNIQGFSFP